MAKKLKKKRVHGLNAQYIFISPVSQVSGFEYPSYYIIAPIKLNFAFGKLPLKKVHRDDFPVLKPILMPQIC